jgi:hypothetical protein
MSGVITMPAGAGASGLTKIYPGWQAYYSGAVDFKALTWQWTYAGNWCTAASSNPPKLR